MSGTFTIDQVNDLIEQHADKAWQAIAQLDTVCQQDQNARTPLNIAIQSHNNDIIRRLVAIEDAIHFSPQLAVDLVSAVKHSVHAIFDGANIEETENYLTNSFGPALCLQRTPLHTACRYADVDTIALLIEKGAGLEEHDAIGLSAFDLCIQFGGPLAVERFITSSIERKRKLKVSDLALRAACTDDALYQQLIGLGTLSLNAKRFAFSFACALLDKVGVARLLENGLDINKTMSDAFSPVLEICTSRLLIDCQHPAAPRLAGQIAAASGGFTEAIKIDNDAIANADSMEDLEALFSASLDDAASKQSELSAYVMSDAERAAQLSQRLELLQVLAEYGLDPILAEKKAPYDFVGDIVRTGAPELLVSLVKLGFNLAPQPGEKDTAIYTALENGHHAVVAPLLQLGHTWGKLKKRHPDWAQAYANWEKSQPKGSATLERARSLTPRAPTGKRDKVARHSERTWELASESVLFAETVPKRLSHNKPVMVRVTHDNVYGPVDGVEFFVQVGDPNNPTAFDAPQVGAEWTAMTLVEELLSIDGEEVERSLIAGPIYDETPWQATYECELSFEPGKHAIEIRVASDIEGMSGVISDWLVSVS